MKKSKKALLGAAMFASALGASVSSNIPNSEIEKTVTASDYIGIYNPEDDIAEPVYGPPAFLGDFDGDGNSNAVDLAFAKRYMLNNGEGFENFLYGCALNIDERDLINIKAFSLSKIAKYGDPLYDEPQPVYGPPIEYETTVEEVTTYEPETDIPQDVYGPPNWFETTDEEVTTYEPETDIPQDVYGPPNWFETADEEVTTYEPETNIPQDVYGPPLDFAESDF